MSRNCSCTAVDFGNEVWLFDAADGSHFRLQQSSLKMSNVTRIFVTHMHADHTLGIVPIMTTLMSGVNAGADYLDKLKQQGRHKKASPRERRVYPIQVQALHDTACADPW